MEGFVAYLNPWPLTSRKISPSTTSVGAPDSSTGMSRAGGYGTNEHIIDGEKDERRAQHPRKAGRSSGEEEPYVWQSGSALETELYDSAAVVVAAKTDDVSATSEGDYGAPGAVSESSVTASHGHEIGEALVSTSDEGRDGGRMPGLIEQQDHPSEVRLRGKKAADRGEGVRVCAGVGGCVCENDCVSVLSIIEIDRCTIICYSLVENNCAYTMVAYNRTYLARIKIGREYTARAFLPSPTVVLLWERISITSTA